VTEHKIELGRKRTSVLETFRLEGTRGSTIHVAPDFSTATVGTYTYHRQTKFQTLQSLFSTLSAASASESRTLQRSPWLANDDSRPICIPLPKDMSWNLLERFIESEHFNRDPSLTVAYLA